MINARIKALRKTLGLTQLEFGQALGRKERAIQYYEKGDRGIDDALILLLKNTYNVNPSWLCDGVGEMFILEPVPQPVMDKNLPVDIQEIIKKAVLLKPKQAAKVLQYLNDQLALGEQEVQHSLDNARKNAV